MVLIFSNFSYFSKLILTILQTIFLSEIFLQFSSTHIGYYKKISSWSNAFCSHSRQLKCQHRRRHHDEPASQGLPGPGKRPKHIVPDVSCPDQTLIKFDQPIWGLQGDLWLQKPIFGHFWPFFGHFLAIFGHI